MKYQLFPSVLAFLLVWPGVFPDDTKIVEKRQSCFGGGCGRPPSPCSGGSCGQSRCSGGGCNDGIIEPNPRRIIPGIIDPRPREPTQPSIRTCSACISLCSSRCSDGQCLNNCLSSCDCRENRQETYDTEDVVDDRGSNNRCCYVMHPKQCYTEETGNKRCFIRRHKECSNLCTSSVVSIQEKQQESRGSSGSSCQYIRNYPYAYCGNYERQNCGQCFSCNGGYNPSECSRRRECSESCRRSIPNPNSCVQTSSGLSCN